MAENMMNDYRQKWIDAFTSDGYMRATGRVPASDVPLPEEGLIDVSGGLFGVGSKVAASKFANIPKQSASAWKKAMHTNDPFLQKMNAFHDARRVVARNSAQRMKIAGDAAGASAFVAPDMYQIFKGE